LINPDPTGGKIPIKLEILLLYKVIFVNTFWLVDGKTLPGGLMDKDKKAKVEKITPDDLLGFIGLSPADNLECINTALAWKSKMIGQQIKGLFGYQRILDAVSKDVKLFGPWAVAAAWQSAFIDILIKPVKAGARIAVGAGRNSDAIADVSGWIYKNYSRLLYALTGYFMKDGKFNREKAQMVCSTLKGKEYLKNYREAYGY
jgi:hypothetical protein